MKINILNKFYILIAIVLLFMIGKSIWDEKGTDLFYNFIGTKKMMTKIEKIKWLAEVNADEYCPVEIYYGFLIDSKGEKQSIPTGEYLQGGWGSYGGTMSDGDEKRKVPEKLEICWFSYAENRFYKGTFDLPQKKMYDIFKKDYGKTKSPSGEDKKNEFNTLLLGFAPQGMVTLWITGIGQIEIGTYQAQDFLMDWKDFRTMGTATRFEEVRMRQKAMLPFVQEDVNRNSINNKYFKQLLERYHYSIGINKTDEYTIYNYGISFLNQEEIGNEVAGLEFLTDIVNSKGLAVDGNIFIKDKFNRHFEVRFDANLLENQISYMKMPTFETRNKNIAFMKLCKDFFEKNKEVQFLIKFNDKIEKSDINKPVLCGKIVLKSPTAELEIPNSRVEFFDAEEW